MATRSEEVLETVRGHLVGRGLDGSLITREARIAEDLDLDSLDTVELTVGMEKAFSIEIPDSELEQLTTIGDAVDLITGKLTLNA